MIYLFKLTLFLLLIRVSTVKQQVIKIVIVVEFIYLCVIGLILGSVRRWFIVLLIVFTALEGVIGLTLLIVIRKFKTRLRQVKFFNW